MDSSAIKSRDAICALQVLPGLEGEGRRGIPGRMKPSLEGMQCSKTISGSPQEIGDYRSARARVEESRRPLLDGLCMYCVCVCMCEDASGQRGE